MQHAQKQAAQLVAIRQIEGVTPISEIFAKHIVSDVCSRPARIEAQLSFPSVSTLVANIFSLRDADKAIFFHPNVHFGDRWFVASRKIMLDVLTATRENSGFWIFDPVDRESYYFDYELRCNEVACDLLLSSVLREKSHWIEKFARFESRN